MSKNHPALLGVRVLTEREYQMMAQPRNNREERLCDDLILEMTTAIRAAKGELPDHRGLE